MDSVRQIHEAAPTGLDVVAQLRLSPTDLDERCDLEWRRGQDDLDAFDYVVLRTDADGPSSVLLAYDDDPERSLIILMESGPTVSRGLDHLLAALGVASEAVIGRSDTDSFEPEEIADVIAVDFRPPAQVPRRRRA